MHNHHMSVRESAGYDFLSGLLCGAVVGAAAGLLLAPRSGTEIRGQMARSAGQLRRQAERTYDRASSVVHDAVDRGREGWQRGRERFEETREAFNHEMSDADDESRTTM